MFVYGLLLSVTMKFLQKDIDKLRKCQANETTKKIHLRGKKESMEQRESNSNASYCN